MPASTMLRVVEREARVYGKLWQASAFSTFVIPIMFLLAMGLGLGGLVDQRTRSIDGVSYLHFVTPGLLAGMAMQSAAPDSLWTVMAGTKWVRFFHGIVATPVSAGDVYGGYVVWSGVRAAMAAVGFVVVAALLGGIASPWGMLAVPAAVLCALAFTAPLVAFAATQTTDISFAVIIRLVIVPLFLFSGTFFPVDQLPEWLQPCGVALAAVARRRAVSGIHDWSVRLVGSRCARGRPVGIVVAGSLWGTRTFAQKLAQ